jgi:diguanylate cyclase (GGDEF)-like protein/PAS domain S-box-containing protein
MNTNNFVSLPEYVDQLLDAICVVDAEGRFVYVSAGFERIFGYKPEEVIGRSMIEMVFPDDREMTLQAANEIMSDRQPQPHFENRYLRKDGQIVHIMWSARWLSAERLRIAVARDITKRKYNEAIQAALYAISEAAHTEDEIPLLFQRIHHIIGALLPAKNFSIALYDKEKGEMSFPYHVDEHAPSPSPHQLGYATLCAHVIRNGQSVLITGGVEGGLPEISPPSVRAGDCRKPQSRLGIPLKSHHDTFGALMVQSYADNVCYTEKDQALLQFVSTQIAATIERKQMVDRLRHLALYDQLTRLPNRKLFYDRLELALARAQREQGQLSLLYLDLDKFKEVNDTFGHGAGDLLLEKVARRLEQCVRACDTVARLSGDEFVIILENIHLLEHTGLVIEKIRTAFDQPFDLKEQKINMMPSIGVAHFPLHGHTKEQLLSHADDAMYLAKKSGENKL